MGAVRSCTATVEDVPTTTSQNNNNDKNSNTNDEAFICVHPDGIRRVFRRAHSRTVLGFRRGGWKEPDSTNRAVVSISLLVVVSLRRVLDLSWVKIEGLRRRLWKV